MQGYTGVNYTIQCPYPTYGDKCQGTAALTYAIGPGAVKLLTILPQVGTLNLFFFNFVNIYTFPSQNN